MANEKQTLHGGLAVSPSLAPDLGELSAGIAGVGIRVSTRVDEDLQPRSEAVSAIWLALYDNGGQILLGAAGNAAWAAMVLAWEKILQKRRARTRLFVSREDGSILINVEGDGQDIANALERLPEVLRSARGEDGPQGSVGLGDVADEKMREDDDEMPSNG